jgi:hypothetical protein
MHAVQPPPPLPSGVAALPIGQAVMRALAKDPQERFRTAEEFSAAIVGRSAQSMEMESLKSAGATAPGQSHPATPNRAEQETTAAGGGIGALVRRFWLPLAIVVLLAALGASLLLFR